MPDAPAPPYDCLVISDLHLGGAVCQARLLEGFLEWAAEHARTLVINGDIFDDLNFKRLKRRHFACLQIIRRHSDRDDFEVIWIRGNHDGPAEIVGHIVGVDVLDETIYDNGAVRLLILHGDQFDRVVTQYTWLTAAATWAFAWIQTLFPHRAARWIRRVSKRFQRNGPLVQRSAIEYARTNGCRFVTCGHTHLPTVAEEAGVRYFNTGTWTDRPPCPFLAVRGAEVALLAWPLGDAPPPAPAPEDRIAETAAESLP
jgi:UDP-2,3-diacylglucosamine pyrophosphatase LpxH